MYAARFDALIVLPLLLGSALPCAALNERTSRDDGHRFRQAQVVVRGTVTGSEAVMDARGRIHTHHGFRVSEVLKGAVSSFVTVRLPGGVVGDVGEAVGCQPSLPPGSEQLLFLNRTREGALIPSDGPRSAVRHGQAEFDEALAGARWRSIVSLDPGVAEVQEASENLPAAGEAISPQASMFAATNLMTDASGIGARFLAPDRGQTIPYLVDADVLPAGMTLEEALGAVTNALAAWESVSPVRFRHVGIETFGQSARDVPGTDGVLRIQLHDGYGEITGGSTLGIGGRYYWTTLRGPDWTTGGRVFGNDFHGTTRGYVVLKHTASGMQDVATFEEVLCHEIGHALGMGHSTPDTPATPGSPAWEAQMYYLAHQDGRGAAPTSWDAGVLRQIHPLTDTPPYAFDRILDAITATPEPSLSGANEVAPCRDLQGLAVTVAIAESTAFNGSFSAANDRVRYHPPGGGTMARIEPPSNSAYDWTYARGTDGTHWSPFVRVQVMSLSEDTHPPGASDGVPDHWMATHFGGAAAGDPVADDDTDGLVNRDEYRSWMNPHLATSAQRITVLPDGTLSWQAKAYEVYEVHRSTDLTDWHVEQAVQPTNGSASLLPDHSTEGVAVYRIFKVP